MFTLQSTTFVPGLRGQQILDFLLRCDDAAYQRWWPGTHLHYRRTGDVVFMDEWIGMHRTTLSGVITELVPGKRMVWQMKKLVRLPARLILDLDDDEERDGVHVMHTIEAGYRGPGRILDPLIRRHLGPDFPRAMDEHVRTEFPRLAAVLG